MASFAAVTVKETGNFGSAVRFGDGEPVNGQDFGLAYAFQDRDSYFDQRRRQCLAVLWRLIGLIQWAAQLLSAFFDATENLRGGERENQQTLSDCSLDRRLKLLDHLTHFILGLAEFLLQSSQ